MLSRLGRFIRGRIARNQARGTEDEGAAEPRTASEAPPERGDAFAQEVLRRVRPPAVTRVPSRPSLPVSGRRPLTQAAPPRVRHDVPSGELPLAASAQRMVPPEEAEISEAPAGDTRFYEGSTGDARWDALWAMRGTQRTVGEPMAPGREAFSPPGPRDQPTPRRSPPAGRGPSVQRAPPQPVQGTGPSGESLARGAEPPVQRAPGEAETERPGGELEGVAHEAVGEESASPRELSGAQDEPRALSPGQRAEPPEPMRGTGEGARPTAWAAPAPTPPPSQERTRPEGTAAPEPSRGGRRIVPRSALEELPARREVPAPSPRAVPTPKPAPQVRADREPTATAQPVPPSSPSVPPLAGTPVQRAPAAPEGKETSSGEKEAPSTEERGSEALPADRVRPVARDDVPGRPPQDASRTVPRTPASVQRIPIQDADRLVERPPVVREVSSAQRAATEEAEPLPPAEAEAPSLLQGRGSPSPATEQPRPTRSLDGRPPVGQPPDERPSSELSPLETPKPARGEQGGMATDVHRAAAAEVEREGPPTALPAAPRGRAESAPSPAVDGRAVRAQPAAPAAGERPVGRPVDQTSAPGRPAVQELAPQESAVAGPAVQRSPAKEPALEKREVASPAQAERVARDRPLPSRAGPPPVEHSAEPQNASAVAARVQREAETEGAGEGELDRRSRLRQAMQPRIVPTVVQAAPADTAQAASPTAAAATPGAAAGGPEEAEEPDVESLARDVYRILRRRLLVERERDLGAS